MFNLIFILLKERKFSKYFYGNEYLESKIIEKPQK